jgi:apolipoprotein N-acyltransferase
MPFQNILPLEKLTDGALGFSAGAALKTLAIPGLPAMTPLICYEVIFSGNVVAALDEKIQSNQSNQPTHPSRANWLLNITNDAWYGTSSGPYQHFAAARLRAVEEGLPLIRVANTGISGSIDGYGRVLSEIQLEVEEVRDVYLPISLEPLFYAVHGPRIPMIICASILLWYIISLVVFNREKFRKHKNKFLK